MDKGFEFYFVLFARGIFEIKNSQCKHIASVTLYQGNNGFSKLHLGAWNLVIESPFSSEKCQEESALRTPCQFGNQVVLQFWWSIITPNLSKQHKISGSSRKTVRLASAGTVGCKGSLIISLKLLQVLGWIIIYIAGKGKCSEKLSMDVTLNVFLKSNTSKCPIVYQAYKMTTIYFFSIADLLATVSASSIMAHQMLVLMSNLLIRWML